MKHVLLISFLMFAGLANSKTIYVSPSGSDANNGTSWNTAVSTLPAALSKAAKGDEIWVAAGTYTATETINLVEGVDIYGGFSGTETSIEQRVRMNVAQPWNFKNETVLTSNGSDFRLIDVPVKNLVHPDRAYVDGIIVKGHSTTNDKICYFDNNYTIRNCQFLENGSGSKILYVEENSTVEDCYFARNFKHPGSTKNDVCVLQGREHHTSDRAGNHFFNCLFELNEINCLSIYNQTNDPGTNYKPEVTEVVGCIFRNNKEQCLSVNTQWLDAKGDYVNDRKVRILNNLFENNTTDTNLISIIAFGKTEFCGNTIRNNEIKVNPDAEGTWKVSLLYISKNARVVNNLFVNNASNGLLMYMGNAAWVGHLTVANNVGTIYVEQNSYAELANSIILNNTPSHNNKIVHPADDMVFLEYLAADQEIANASPMIVTTNDKTFKKPTSFVGLAQDEQQKAELLAADFSLLSSSECIAAGGAVYTDMGLEQGWIDANLKTDIDGNEMNIKDGKVNLGAYQGDMKSGIEEVSAGKQLCEVYAANGVLEIRSMEVGEASVYTMDGTMVASQSLNGRDVKLALANGLYIVRVITSNGTQSFKVIL